MSETKSLAAPKASFDRRAVVKGAAWSVPVIAAAIAAPAAAASTPASVSFTGEGGPAFKFSGAGNKTGSAPTGFIINNPSGANFAGNATVYITITRDASDMPGIFVGTIQGGTRQSPGTYSGNTVTSTFLLAVNAPAGLSQTFTMGSYSQNGNGSSPAGTYSMTILIDLTGGGTLSGVSTKQITLSK